MKEPIAITSIASLSPLGISSEEVWRAYGSPDHFLAKKTIGATEEWVAPLPIASKPVLDQIRNEDARYGKLDDTVLYALYVGRQAIRNAGWEKGDSFGINIGSSRGATALFESYHGQFLETGKSSVLSSPTTTLGNISSWLAHDLRNNGPEISHSITCSTALHAVLNGVAWIRSGMVDRFLVGGSEAPLTPFTLAQMKALKIYAPAKDRTSTMNGIHLGTYPCRALDLEKKMNTMVLGEASAVACLQKGPCDHGMAWIRGIGYATEVLEHNVSLSRNALCFQRSMNMALRDAGIQKVDAIVMHAPGTIKGDQAEYRAIQEVFGEKMPALTTNKWQVGHSFGASGMLSMEMAVFMLGQQVFIPVPYLPYSTIPEKIDTVMVNAVGFGGNAVSLLLSRN